MPVKLASSSSGGVTLVLRDCTADVWPWIEPSPPAGDCACDGTKSGENLVTGEFGMDDEEARGIDSCVLSASFSPLKCL